MANFYKNRHANNNVRNDKKLYDNNFNNDNMYMFV